MSKKIYDQRRGGHYNKLNNEPTSNDTISEANIPFLDNNISSKDERKSGSSPRKRESQPK